MSITIKWYRVLICIFLILMLGSSVYAKDDKISPKEFGAGP
jgi:hypothetical protein